MARTLTPLDAHAIMNELVQEATGQKAITAVDTSSFVSAGEMVLATGMENTLNALSLVLGRTLIAVRPYKAKLNLINALDTGAYTHRLRKISFYSKDALPAGDWNTDLYTNFAEGYDNGTNGATGSTPPTNSTGSQFEQHRAIPLQLSMGGSSVWQDAITFYEYQVKQAFRDESSFNQFVAGFLTEKGNDIESQKEAFNRMTLLNRIAGSVDMNATGAVVNMTKAFNDYYGTAYTTAQLQTTYFTEFLEFFIAEFKIISDRLTYRTAAYHSAPTISGHSLLRHTPKDKQRCIMYNPFFIKAEAMVKPAIFNPQYLDIDKQAEFVDFWQNPASPSEIDITPAITDFDSTSATYGTQIAGSNVNLKYLLGVLYDEDAVMTDFQMEYVRTSALEARKGYRTQWYGMARNSISDYTENFVVFYMADPAKP